MTSIHVAKPSNLSALLLREVASSRSRGDRLPRKRSDTNATCLAIDCPGSTLASLNDLKVDSIDVALVRPPVGRLNGRQKLVVWLKLGESSQLRFVDIGDEATNRTFRKPTASPWGPARRTTCGILLPDDKGIGKRVR